MDSLQVMLLPRDPNDDRNIMLEVRAGTGGSEAGIWAGDMLSMYVERGRCCCCCCCYYYARLLLLLPLLLHYYYYAAPTN